MLFLRLIAHAFGSKTTMKGFFNFLIVATILTFASMVYEYQYCTGGMGRGIPFAILKPSHYNDLFAIQLEPAYKVHGLELSFSSIIYDILSYTVIFWIIAFIIGKIRNLHRTSKSNRKKTAEQGHTL